MIQQRHYQNTFRKKLMKKIESLKGEVFTRNDLSRDRSNKHQLRLNRALKAFINQGHIIKISHNLYAKAMTMNFSDGKSRVVLREAFESVVTEALEKLGIHWEFGQAIQEYNRGETTQVPAIFSIRLHSRFRGTIRAEGRAVHFEGDTNAR